MTDYTLIAIKLGDILKYSSSRNEVNRIAGAMFDFNKKEHPNANITSVIAQSVYDWVLTLSEQDLTEDDKISILSRFIKELAPEYAISKLPEGLDIEKKKSEREKPKDVDSKNVFVLMPFEERFQALYYKVIKPVVELLGYSISKADENLSIGTVIEQIQQSIRDARLVVADVSGKNANVFYELGYAHGVNQNVLIMTTKTDDVPFDISHIRYFQYSYEPKSYLQNFDNLQDQFYPIFKQNLEAISNGT